MFKIKRSRKSKIELNEFKDKLWQLIDGRGSIPTKTIIISMDLKPYDTRDYGYFMKIVGDCRKEAILQWTSFKHLHKDNKEIFKKFKEYLFKKHLPLIFFDKKNKASYIPETYEQMEEWVGRRIATEYSQFINILQIAEISDMKLLSNEMARKIYLQMDNQKKLFYQPLEDDKKK